jgi:hypothetical protein
MIIATLIIFILFLFLRLTTFRSMNTQDTTYLQDPKIPYYFHLQEFHHRETDELIFANLVSYIQQNITDYTLYNKSILNDLGLSKENYNHRLFLHPPFFVYSSAALHHFFTIPLVAIPLLYHTITLLCLPWIVYQIIGGQYNWGLKIGENWIDLHVFSWSRIAILSMLFYSLCPILWFTSQRFWIDNALVMTSTLVWTWHLYLIVPFTSPVGIIHNSKTSSIATAAKSTSMLLLYLRTILSGYLYGLFALNTKITALALIPGMICWIVYQHQHHLTISSLLLEIMTWFIAIFSGYFPWLYWYHQQTGRWLPSAWPSKNMIERFAFVRTAVNRPWYFYVVTLNQLSPFHLIGFGLGIITIGYLFIRWFYTLWRRLISCQKEHDYAHKKTDEIVIDNPVGSHPLVSSHETIKRNNNQYFIDLCYRIAINAIPSLGYFGGLNLIGILGGGYQMRFLLPALPMTVILAAIAIEFMMTSQHSMLIYMLQKQHCFSWLQTIGWFMNMIMINVWFYLLMFSMAILGFYYGGQYASFYADIDTSLIEIVGSILQSPYRAFTSRDVMTTALEAMKHCGFTPAGPK